MPKSITLVSLVTLTKGQRFDVTPGEALALTRLRYARLLTAEDNAPIDPPKTRRQYRRRDLIAES